MGATNLKAQLVASLIMSTAASLKVDKNSTNTVIEYNEPPQPLEPRKIRRAKERAARKQRKLSQP